MAYLHPVVWQEVEATVRVRARAPGMELWPAIEILVRGAFWTRSG
jgi:hypothetical protein